MMRKLLFGAVLSLILAAQAYGQQYMTRNGFIGFYSKMPLEEIKADNNQVYAVIDAGKKNIAFVLLMKGFLFERELQQEHFNENYAESDKYPKASFSGAYTGDVNLAQDAVYKVTVKGDLTIHGVTRPVEEPATIAVKAGKLIGKCVFKISPEDYKIGIPGVVRDKIARQITITVLIDCNPK